MSKLFYTETGRTIHCANEELTGRRHARKVLKLPAEVASDARLYFLAASRPDCTMPLRVTVNGHPFEVAPDGKTWVHWYILKLRREMLKPGDNTIDFWCDAWAQDSWMLGLESGHPKPRSFLSFDGGKTWQNRHMGVLIRMPGEYVVRLRLDDPKRRDPAPPAFIWEDRNCEYFDKIRELIPAGIKAIADPWEKTRALVSWTIVQWRYRNVLTGGVDYAPWDLPTIISWGSKSFGHWHKDPVVMCVHYAIVTTTAALA
ncbi:MAG: hypothetical protein HY343_07095, partial [Lentisphaerae bacterium]|nr:hypothetical protein [Lentisphaerota bacterium]